MHALLQDKNAKKTTPNTLDLLLRVIDLLPNPVYVKDRDHKWVEVNKAFCDFLGQTRDHMIGLSDFDLFPAEQAQIFWDMDDHVFRDKTANVNVERTTNHEGQLAWVESRKDYYRAPDGAEYIIGVVTDITELKRREAALEIAEAEARAGADAKTTFLANMSHEIRTPMNGVLGMAQVLRGTPLSDRQTQMVDTLERSGESLLRLIDDILDFSKIDAGHLEISEAPFDLHDMVHDIGELLGVSARDKGLDLIIDRKPDLPRHVIGDDGRIKQILTNLLGNAVKFTEKGYVALRLSGHVEAGYLQLAVSVEDTGIGIAAEKLPRIFEKFLQADGSTTRIYGGTGLGLTISRELAELLGGTLTATSQPGKGSVFRLTLPLKIDTEKRVAPRSPNAKALPDDLRILVVDDIALNLEITNAQLYRLGFEADTAETAEAAVRALVAAHKTGRPYDLLLTDYLMPGADGLRLVQTLRQRAVFKDLRIIVQSSVNAGEVRKRFLAAGATDYLVKPVSPNALSNALSALERA